jgi:hypothetical protein
MYVKYFSEKKVREVTKTERKIWEEEGKEEYKKETANEQN